MIVDLTAINTNKEKTIDMLYKETTTACPVSSIQDAGNIVNMHCPCPPPPPPPDELKFTAYKKVVASYDEAVKIAVDKKLSLGEPAVIPFFNGDDIELLFAIGSMTSTPFIKDSATMDNLDNAWIIEPGTGKQILIVDWIKKMKSDILTIINTSNKQQSNINKKIDASISELKETIAVQNKALNTKIDKSVSSLQSQISKIDSSVHNMPNILASDKVFINALVNSIYSNDSFKNNLQAIIEQNLVEFASNYQYKTFYGTLYE